MGRLAWVKQISHQWVSWENEKCLWWTRLSSPFNEYEYTILRGTPALGLIVGRKKVLPFPLRPDPILFKVTSRLYAPVWAGGTGCFWGTCSWPGSRCRLWWSHYAWPFPPPGTAPTPPGSGTRDPGTGSASCCPDTPLPAPGACETKNERIREIRGVKPEGLHELQLTFPHWISFPLWRCISLVADKRRAAALCGEPGSPGSTAEVRMEVTTSSW